MFSTTNREDPEYFSLASKHDRESTSSPPASPTGTVERLPIHVSPPTPRTKTRPTYRNRPHSDHETIHSRVKVQTIEEDVTADKAPSKPTRQSAAHATSISFPPRPRTSDSAGATSAVRPASVSSYRSTGSGLATVGDLRHESKASTAPPTRPRPGHVWNRSRSGSIWYERLRQSPGQSRGSSKASEGSSNVPNRLLTPLRPPSTPGHGSQYVHKVRVEKSFTELRARKSQQSDHVSSQGTTKPASKNTSRKSSVDPRRLFSLPMRLIREFNQQPTQVIDQHEHRETDLGDIGDKLRMPDHSSFWRRNQTQDALRLVSSILSSDPVTTINPLTTRTMSERSDSDSHDFKKSRKEKKAERGLLSPVTIHSNRSISDLARPPSQTSSQLELRRGAVPTNTPDEKATYRIKRSPSAESEEFLKIDISIRGGTSYLPSEARRIHTPPLPANGLDGKKRGFFFDYNAPKSEQSQETSIVDDSPTKIDEDSMKSKLPRRDTSRVSTIGKSALDLKRRITKTKTNDWYEAQLAQLEADDEAEVDLDTENMSRVASRGRSTTTTSCSEFMIARKKKKEEEMDYNIPEHLPNSALCPRNKKYWRVVQGRGSQYRGCWMHGIGEIE